MAPVRSTCKIMKYNADVRRSTAARCHKRSRRARKQHECLSSVRETTSVPSSLPFTYPKRALTPNSLLRRRIMPKRLRAHERVPSPRVLLRSLSQNGSPAQTHLHCVLKSPPNEQINTTSHQTTNTNQQHPKPAPQRNEATHQRHRRPAQTQTLAIQQRNPVNVAQRFSFWRSEEEAGLQSNRVFVECCGGGD